MNAPRKLSQQTFKPRYYDSFLQGQHQSMSLEAVSLLQMQDCGGRATYALQITREGHWPKAAAANTSVRGGECDDHRLMLRRCHSSYLPSAFKSAVRRHLIPIVAPYTTCLSAAKNTSLTRHKCGTFTAAVMFEFLPSSRGALHVVAHSPKFVRDADVGLSSGPTFVQGNVYNPHGA